MPQLAVPPAAAPDDAAAAGRQFAFTATAASN
jgi:hypothetical protein